MSSSDLEALRAFQSALSAFIDFAKVCSESLSKKRPPPDPVERRDELLGKLRAARLPALNAARKISSDFHGMDHLLLRCISRCETYRREDHPLTAGYETWVGGFSTDSRTLSDLIQMAELELKANDGGPVAAMSEGSPKKQTPPSAKQLEFMHAMLRLNATDEARRKTTADIVRVAAGPDANPESYKRRVSDLQKRGLIDTTDIPGGGCWLTAAGISHVKTLKKA